MRFLDSTVEYQGFWGSFWDLIWWFLWAFIFISYLFALFAIISDLFRDKTLSGGWKAVWIFFLIFFPIITALVYLVVRGKGMSERHLADSRRAQDSADSYIRQVAGSSPSDEIAKAKQLLDTGTITTAEYESLKARALS